MKSKDQQLLEEAYKSVLNGLAKGKSIQDIATKHDCSIKHIQQQLDAGIKIEHEHTKDNAIAREIAMDHLFEDPNYYTKIKSIEAK
jgi:hypothetical protein